MQRLPVFLVSMVLCVPIQSAWSSEFIVELATPKKASLQVIGSIPPKRHIEMELGTLRTTAARLPDGERDLKARMRLRNRRALERQKAVGGAKREANEDVKEVKAKPDDAKSTAKDKGGKKAANVSKKKTKIRLKMKNHNKKRKKRPAGKSGKTAAAKPDQSRPVSIN